MNIPCGTTSATAGVNFADLDGDNEVDETEILQQNHYYPFGMNIENPAWSGTNGYQYNGKELNTDFGLDWNDYGARWYDAGLGRFTTVDPLASIMPGWSPYSYTFNNPIAFTDPLGLAPSTSLWGDDIGSEKREEGQGRMADAYQKVENKNNDDPKNTWEEAIGRYFEQQAEQKVIDAFNYSKLSDSENELVEIANEMASKSGTKKEPQGANQDVYNEQGSFLVGRWKVEYDKLIAYSGRKSDYRFKDVEFGNFSFNHSGSSDPQFRVIGFSFIEAKSYKDNARRPELAFLRMSAADIRLLRLAQTSHARNFAVSIITIRYSKNIEKQEMIMRTLERKGAFDY